MSKSNTESSEPLQTDHLVSFVLVADNEFSLTNGIVKPHPDKRLTEKKIFTYRI